jgi:hypothetical protein
VLSVRKGDVVAPNQIIVRVPSISARTSFNAKKRDHAAVSEGAAGQHALEGRR